MADTIALRTARHRINSFARVARRPVKQRRVKRTEDAALDNMECEAFLQLGIDAFHWLVRADETIRKAIYTSDLPADPEMDRIIQDLFVQWLAPAEFAGRWIGMQQSNGLTPENLQEFVKCEAEVRAIVKSFDLDNTLPAPMRALRDEAIAEHRDGQTAEFI